jgi:putative copper resistance protein D
MLTALLVLARALHIGSALLLASLLFFRPAYVPVGSGYEPAGARFTQRLSRWLIGAWIVQLLSGAVWFALVAADMNGVALPEIFDSTLLTTVLTQTQFGQLWIGRAIVGAVLGPILLLLWRRPSAASRSTLITTALSLSVLLLLSLAWAGHASSGSSYRALHLSADVLHLALGAVWPVGLVPLLLFLKTAAADNEPAEFERAVITLKNFSRASLAAVLLLFLTGFVNAWLAFPSFASLFISTYGQLLLAKVALFLGMIVLGARNRFVLLPGLHATLSSRSTFAKLRTAVLLESLLAAIVLLIVGLMGITAPPAPH